MNGAISLKSNYILPILVILALVLLILATYWQVQNSLFIDYDDQLYVTENYLIESEISPKSISRIFKDVHTGNWHPLTMLSHMLDWQLFGYNAGGHHWTNVILHVFNTILLFLLLWMMSGALWRSAFVAGLFAIHPVNVESVAWIAERKNVLSTFFWFLTMICYVWYVRVPSWKRYLPVVICFVLGLMAKAMLVTLPFVLLLMDYWPLNRTKILGQTEQVIAPVSLKTENLSVLLLEKVPLFAVSIIFVFLTVYAQQTVYAIASIDLVPFTSRAMNAVVSYMLYIRKLLLPTDLSVFYPQMTISWWQASLAATFLIVVTGFVCRYYKKHPYLIVGWLWFLGTLVPVIGLVQVGRQAMADRYAYVSFIGLFVIIAWLVPQALSKIRHAKTYILSVFLVLISFFTFLSYIQIGKWKDTTTLFQHAFKINPNNYMAFNILGSEESRKGNHEQALQYYQVALKIDPKYARAYSNAGNECLKLGRYAEAHDFYQKAISINGKLSDAHYNLGVLTLLMNKPSEAVVHFNKALILTPNFVRAHFNMGVAFLKVGNFSGATEHFEKALELNPRHTEARKGLLISRELQKKKKPNDL